MLCERKEEARQGTAFPKLDYGTGPKDYRDGKEEKKVHWSFFFLLFKSPLFWKLNPRGKQGWPFSSLKLSTMGFIHSSFLESLKRLGVWKSKLTWKMKIKENAYNLFFLRRKTYVLVYGSDSFRSFALGRTWFRVSTSDDELVSKGWLRDMAKSHRKKKRLGLREFLRCGYRTSLAPKGLGENGEVPMGPNFEMF